MISVTYIGTSSSIIEELISYKSFTLKRVICEEKRITDNYKSVIEKNKLELLTINNKKDLIDSVLKIGSASEVFLIYQFDFIVPKVLTESYSFFNLHSGSLKTNRGAHPIIWSVLNGDKKSSFSLHKINDKIDQGELIFEYKIAISNADSPSVIKTKMEVGFKEIFHNLELYLKGEKDSEEITGGTYYPFITVKDFTIDIEKDSEQTIKNKIRSQQDYKGAVFHLKKKKYYIKSFSELEKILSLI